ncbi:MAG TPA: hypothetical protein VGZ22_20370 [Isosphaeraceae bacterium]|jgi:hypothetical protein|nr:hypothetical protein [Isosphaeraceae bacterium]
MAGEPRKTVADPATPVTAEKANAAVAALWNAIEDLQRRVRTLEEQAGEPGQGVDPLHFGPNVTDPDTEVEPQG